VETSIKFRREELQTIGQDHHIASSLSFHLVTRLPERTTLQASSSRYEHIATKSCNSDVMVRHSVQTLVGATQTLKILAVCHARKIKRQGKLLPNSRGCFEPAK
jgi:hypothetical protein